MTAEDRISLSERAVRVGESISWTVLPSARQLVGVGDLSEDQVKRGLRELRNKGLVRVHELGCLLPAVPLVRWRKRGLRRFVVSEWERSWVGPDGLGNLALYDFAKMEAVNAVAPFYAGGDWKLWRILFFEREPMVAVVEYHDAARDCMASLVCCWTSMMDTQRELCERIEALEEAMQAHAMDPRERFRPAGIALLAASEWGAARALCLARAVLDGWVEPRSIAGWYHGSDGWRVSDAVSALSGSPPSVMPPFLERRHRVRPPVASRKLGRRKLKNILARSLWAGGGGHKLVQLLTLVAIFPCGDAGHYRSLMGEKPGGTGTRKRLGILERKAWWRWSRSMGGQRGRGGGRRMFR